MRRAITRIPRLFMPVRAFALSGGATFALSCLHGLDLLGGMTAVSLRRGPFKRRNVQTRTQTFKQDTNVQTRHKRSNKTQTFKQDTNVQYVSCGEPERYASALLAREFPLMRSSRPVSILPGGPFF